MHFICLCSAFPRLHYPSLSQSLFLSLSPSLPLSPPLNPSASCRSVRLPVSVPIRFHLIHVTSINTQSSPDKSRPLSPPLCLSCVALHHSVFPNKLSSPHSLVTMYKITCRLHEVVKMSSVVTFCCGDRCFSPLTKCSLLVCVSLLFPVM